jgi:hypothetical protein
MLVGHRLREVAVDVPDVRRVPRVPADKEVGVDQVRDDLAAAVVQVQRLRAVNPAAIASASEGAGLAGTLARAAMRRLESSALEPGRTKTLIGRGCGFGALIVSPFFQVAVRSWIRERWIQPNTDPEFLTHSLVTDSATGPICVSTVRGHGLSYAGGRGYCLWL